jgi:hypothetical protein
MLKDCVVDKKPNPGKQHHITSLLLMQWLYLGLVRVPPVSELPVHPPCVGE